jgi:hypothetical protein
VIALVSMSLAAQDSSGHSAKLSGLPSYSFGPTGIYGGGFQNVVAVDPRGELVIAGGDVSGFSRSTDGGRTWSPSNAGVWTISMRAVASIVFSPTDPNTIYAATGSQHRPGGFLVSEDGGITWEARSSVPRFSGTSNSVTGLPSTHPRSTGTLIASDPAMSLLYAATFDDGVMRSPDGGHTWTTIGLAGFYLRSITIDPSNTDTILVATYGRGVWRATQASDQAIFERVAEAPAVVEEITVVGTDMYAAAGSDGIYRVADGGRSWTRLGAGSLPDSGPAWTTIAGIAGCQGTTLYAGAHGGGAWSLARSSDGGATWGSVTGTEISTSIGGPGGMAWWLAGKMPQMMLGGTGYTAGQLAVVPPDMPCGPEHVLLAGRSGVWGSPDGGSSWFPFVEGMATTVTHSVAVDPAAPGRVAAGVSDWGHLFSTNAAEGVSMAAPAGVTDAFDVAFDVSTSPSGTLLATGHALKNAKGEVFSAMDPTGTWRDEGLSAAVTKRVLAVAAGRNAAGTRVLVAAVDAGGVWRKVGSGSWRKAPGSPMSTVQKTSRASIAWPAGTSTIYLYDRQSGVWRSNDTGATWTKIWAQPSRADMTGFVAATDRQPSTLFVAVGDQGIFRIDSAMSGTVGGALSPVRIGTIATPGPIAVHGDRLLATRLAGPGTPPQLFVSDDRGSTWTPVGDAYYESSALNPRDIAVGPDGTIYVALNGGGLVRGRPSPV